jgi:hypothetical protein
MGLASALRDLLFGGCERRHQRGGGRYSRALQKTSASRFHLGLLGRTDECTTSVAKPRKAQSFPPNSTFLNTFRISLTACFERV